MWTVIGFLVTPIALGLAVVSGGAGHGDYAFARLFYPYSMLLTRLNGDSITGPLITMAILQFPIYGVILDLTVAAAGKTRLRFTVMCILVLHVIAAAMCFSGLIPNFS